VFWNPWKKKSAKKESPKANVERLSKPQTLPQAVGREIIVQSGKNPDWVWHLKSVVRQSNKGKHRYNVRVFDETQAYERGVKVQNYNTLNENPELILFEGWYDRKSWKAHIKEKERPELTTKAA